jgi:hypothetical protein
MSMIMSFAAVSDRNISRLLADPRLVWQVVAPDEEIEEDFDPPKASFLSRLFGKARVEPPELLEFGAGELETVDIDKAWDLIDRLLTFGSAASNPALDFISHGGQDIGNIDVGYGPARAFTSAEASEIASWLGERSDDVLRSQIDLSRFRDENLYGGLQPGDDPEPTLNYLFQHLRTMREFFAATTRAGHGFVLWVQ